MSEEIVIIHPGSLYLRLGKANDLNPELILNCVARRRKTKDSPAYSDTLLPRSVPKTSELTTELDESRLSVSHMLQSQLQSDGRKRYGASSAQLSAFNKRAVPEIITTGQATHWLKPKENVNLIVGADVLRLNPNSDFNIHFPIRRGQLNIHNNVDGTATATIDHIKTIWEFAIKNFLDVNLKDLNKYRAVLIIPDIYNRKTLKMLAGLLFEMGFKACIMIQEHVAASFGTGLNCTCVVDIGDQKISISCVEDAISHQNTRVSLKFGGGDVTMCFFWLLQKCSFPYKECQPSNNQDAALLNHLKEQYCHIDLDICGSQEKSFIINRPNQSPCRYVLQIADELIISPLSLFYTDLLKFTLGSTPRDKIIQIQKTLGQDFDSEDCFNAEFLRETGRRNAKDTMETTFNMNDASNADAEEDAEVDVELMTKFNANDFQTSNGHIGLDSAILQSIEHLSNDDLKRKMYNCILLVGSGSKIPGLQKWLQNKIQQSIPQNYRMEGTQDIVMTVKDVDPGNVCWRGASLLTTLETAEELWVTREDWQSFGVRALREKVPFIW